MSVVRELAVVPFNLGQLKPTCSTDTTAQPEAGTYALPYLEPCIAACIAVAHHCCTPLLHTCPLQAIWPSLD